ncbi:MAG: PKD domain-containing protein [Saprospiraceae bacterium]|nr:PKD domain-containing protein [Saprospiraceae bacterium]
MRQAFLLMLFIGLGNCAFAQEICTNGIDDDGDGLIDLQDPDCICNGIHPWEPSDLIVNPSFDEKTCCPPTFSQMDCLSDWQQGTTATSDYMHTCAFVMPAVINAGLVPFPSDSGAVGIIIDDNWSEYIATCASSPLLAGQAYRLTIQIASIPVTNFGSTCNDGIIEYPEIELAVWGNPTCAFPVETIGCPSQVDSLWQILGASIYQPESKWTSFSITFIPSTDMNGLMIGATCDLPDFGYSGSPCYTYFVLDDLVLETTEALDLISVTDNGLTDKNNYTLIAEVNDTSGTWQWYFEGVALQDQVESDFYFKTNNYKSGSYQVTYSKDGQCIQDSFQIDLPPPQAMVGMQEVHQDTFHFLNRSKYALEYIWHFGDGTTSSEEEPLFHQYPGPGIYNGYLVAINHCCSDTFSFTVPIFQPPYLLDSFLVPHTCDSLGTIILDILSSTPFSCEWSNGIITDDPIICELTPGQYSVKVTNQNGQSSFGLFTIDSSTIGFQGTVDIATFPTCATPPTGIITLKSSGTDSIFLYHWSHDPNLKLSVAENLPAGEYQVTITDSFGCQKDITINLPDQGPTIESLLIDPPLCQGEQSGTLDILISGPNGPFIIEVQNLSTSMQKLPPYQLDRGDYRIDIMDANGCSTTREFKVADPPAIQIEFLIGLDLDGQPTILSPKVSQGIPPYSFLWSDGSTAPTRSDLSPGIYQVTVTDCIGCTRISEVKFGIPGGGAIGNGGLQIEKIPGSTELRFDGTDFSSGQWAIHIYSHQGQLLQSYVLSSDHPFQTWNFPYSGVFWIHAGRSDGYQYTLPIFSY